MEDRGLDITGPSEMNEWVPELNQGNIMGQCNILVYHDFLETKGGTIFKFHCPRSIVWAMQLKREQLLK